MSVPFEEQPIEIISLYHPFFWLSIVISVFFSNRLNVANFKGHLKKRDICELGQSMKDYNYLNGKLQNLPTFRLDSNKSPIHRILNAILGLIKFNGIWSFFSSFNLKFISILKRKWIQKRIEQVASKFI